MSRHCYACIRGISRPEDAPICASCYDRQTGEARHFEPKPPREARPAVEYEARPTTISCGV